MKLKAVDLVRDIRDRAFEMTCEMQFEERREFIHQMVEKTEQRMEEAGYMVSDDE